MPIASSTSVVADARRTLSQIAVQSTCLAIRKREPVLLQDRLTVRAQQEPAERARRVHVGRPLQNRPALLQPRIRAGGNLEQPSLALHVRRQRQRQRDDARRPPRRSARTASSARCFRRRPASASRDRRRPPTASPRPRPGRTARARGWRSRRARSTPASAPAALRARHRACDDAGAHTTMRPMA